MSPCSEDSGKRSFHAASNYDGVTERFVMIDVDGEMIEVSKKMLTDGPRMSSSRLNIYIYPTIYTYI